MPVVFPIGNYLEIGMGVSGVVWMVLQCRQTNDGGGSDVSDKTSLS